MRQIRLPFGSLFHRDAFREVAGFIHVAITGDGDVVSQELQRHDGQERGEAIQGSGDVDDVVNFGPQLGVAFGSDGNNRTATRFHFFDIALGLLVDLIEGRDEIRPEA